MKTWIRSLIALSALMTACDPALDGDGSLDPMDRPARAGGKADVIDVDCDDGSHAVCLMVEPDCPEGTVSAVSNGCFTCADAETCEPLGLPLNCDDGEPAFCLAAEPNCGLYATAALIGGCWQCVDAFSCEPIEPPAPEPEAGSCEDACGGQSPDGCWCDDACSDYGDCCDDVEEACEEEQGPCDDGTLPVCLIVEPQCADDEILAYQNGCVACVDPVTCQ